MATRVRGIKSAGVCHFERHSWRKRLACSIPGAILWLGGITVVFLSVLGPGKPSEAADEEGTVITTSKSTFKLPPIPKLSGQTAQSSALRVAEIAMSDLVADSARLEQEMTNVAQEKDSVAQKMEQDVSQWKVIEIRFDKDKTKFEHRLTNFEWRVEQHNADAARNQAHIAASNALPAHKRTRATVERLNTERKQINSRKVALDADRTALVKEENALNASRQLAIAFLDEANSRVNAYQKLCAQLKDLSTKQELAYRQLKQCHQYALEIRRNLKDSHGVNTTFSPELETAMERLKALSGQGFDGNSPKPQLTR